MNDTTQPDQKTRFLFFAPETGRPTAADAEPPHGGESANRHRAPLPYPTLPYPTSNVYVVYTLARYLSAILRQRIRNVYVPAEGSA